MRIKKGTSEKKNVLSKMWNWYRRNKAEKKNRKEHSRTMYAELCAYNIKQASKLAAAERD